MLANIIIPTNKCCDIHRDFSSMEFYGVTPSKSPPYTVVPLF